MRRFSELGESERGALLAALSSSQGRAPLLAVPPVAPWPAALSLAMLVSGLGGAIALASQGFGSLLAEGALQGTSSWPLYLLTLGMFLLGMVPPLHRRWLAKRANAPLGTYLFPTALVQVEGGDIVVHRFEASPRMETTHGPYDVVVNIVDGSQRSSFRVPRTMEAMSRIALAASAIRACRMSIDARDMAWLLQVDPLVGPGPDVVPRGPRPVPKLLQRPWPLVLVLSMLVGPAFSILRDDLSDSRIVDNLRQSEDVAALRWYASSEGDLAEEAAQVWLPKLAETRFARGVQLQSSGYWASYLNDFKFRADEVRAVHLPDALLGEAVNSGSVATLRGFIATHSADLHKARRTRAQEVIDEQYATARSAFDSQAIEGRRIRQAMDAMFEWLRLHNTSAVQVVFRPADPAGIESADRILARGRDSLGCSRATPAAPFLQRERLTYAEGRIVELLQKGFESVAPNDVLSLEATPIAALDPARPRFEVEYRVMPLGSARNPVVFVQETTSECLLGLSVRFDIRLSPPGQVQPHTIKVNAEPPDHFTVTTYGRFTTASTDSAYDRMLGLAFDNLATALRTRLFASDSEASSRMEEALQGWGAEAEAKAGDAHLGP